MLDNSEWTNNVATQTCWLGKIMKKFISGFMVALCCSAGLFSAPIKIEDATYNSESEMLEIKIFYACGTMEHSFDVSFGPVRQTYPMSVTATVRHLEGANDLAQSGCFETLQHDVSDIVRPIEITVTNEDNSSQKKVSILE